MHDFLLEARDKGLIQFITDNGGGGLSSSIGESARYSNGCQIELEKVPLKYAGFDPWEIWVSESQERMGLVIHQKDLDYLHRLADRERSPIYDVGKVTDDFRFAFRSSKTGKAPMDFSLTDMFGSSPHTIMNDSSIQRDYKAVDFDAAEIYNYTEKLL